MISAPHRNPKFLAALVHRLSGIALAVFLPLHFFALGRALDGAAAFDSFLAATSTPLAKFAEGGLVVALAVHMTLGLRVLAIELHGLRERSAAWLSACGAAALAVGLVFLLNVG